ncbi:MAG: tetratricopeptide repeat protein [Acetobacteraceae bacterium]
MRSFFHSPTILTCALLAVAQVPAPALAQMDSREAISLQNQIYQLRQELQMLRDQGMRGGGMPQPRPYGAPSGGGSELVAQLLTRVDALEEQVRQLRGRVDEAQNQLQRQNAELGKRIDDLAFQMSAAPGAGAPAAATRPTAPPSQASPPPPTPVQPAGPRVRTPELALQEGNSALARRDYAGAEAAAREVLANRTSPRAYDAQMLLAQALSGQRQYPQAAIAYDDAYNRNRKGSHAQDALLGLANSLTAINEKKAACDTLNRLRNEFPQPRADLRDAIVSAGQRAGCR